MPWALVGLLILGFIIYKTGHVPTMSDLVHGNPVSSPPASLNPPAGAVGQGSGALAGQTPGSVSPMSGTATPAPPQPPAFHLPGLPAIRIPSSWDGPLLLLLAAYILLAAYKFFRLTSPTARNAGSFLHWVLIAYPLCLLAIPMKSPGLSAWAMAVNERIGGGYAHWASKAKAHGNVQKAAATLQATMEQNRVPMEAVVTDERMVNTGQGPRMERFQKKIPVARVIGQTLPNGQWEFRLQWLRGGAVDMQILQGWQRLAMMGAFAHALNLPPEQVQMDQGRGVLLVSHEPVEQEVEPGLPDEWNVSLHEEEEPAPVPQDLFTGAVREGCPPLSVLPTPPGGSSPLIVPMARGRLMKITGIVERLGVEADPLGGMRGPTVEIAYLRPMDPTKVRKLLGQGRDIAGQLGMGEQAARVTYAEGQEGAAAIEIPVERRKRGVVHLLSVLGNNAEDARGKDMPLAMGVMTNGQTLWVDAADFPHMLIAGAPGSGKSAAINAAVFCLSITTRPEDLIIYMVDMKGGGEFGWARDLPHVRRVLTQAVDVAELLQELIGEMDRRYAELGQMGVNGIRTARKRFGKAYARYLIVVDEYADVKSVLSPAEQQAFELALQRMNQIGRAAGFHVWVSTQKPTVDVVDSVIKSNIPGRWAFKVATGGDSRVILDAGGAETLTGKGDSLVLGGLAGVTQLTRIQTGFVAGLEEAESLEVHAVVEWWKENGGRDNREE